MPPKPTKADRQQLHRALEAAAQQDPKIARLVAEHGHPEPRIRAHGFATLMQIIVAQQLSTKAAAAIWSRVEALLEPKVLSQAVLTIDAQSLRDCGLSWRKVEYSQALAKQFETGQLDSDSLTGMDTDAVIKTLTSIKGFGIWSAEIYAMFALRHTDVFPAGDLALQVAVQRLLKWDQRPSEKQTRLIAERWSPHRSSVALMLWKFYGTTTLGENNR